MFEKIGRCVSQLGYGAVVADFRTILAVLYANQGRYAEAEPLLERALAGRERALGAEHPETLVSLKNLALLYERQGRYAEAEPFYARALAGRERVLGAEHPDALDSLNNLAGCPRPPQTPASC